MQSRLQNCWVFFHIPPHEGGTADWLTSLTNASRLCCMLWEVCFQSQWGGIPMASLMGKSSTFCWRLRFLPRAKDFLTYSEPAELATYSVLIHCTIICVKHCRKWPARVSFLLCFVSFVVARSRTDDPAGLGAVAVQSSWCQFLETVLLNRQRHHSFHSFPPVSRRVTLSLKLTKKTSWPNFFPWPVTRLIR